MVIFNKSDLFDRKDIDKKLNKFKKKIKKKVEVISVFSQEDLKKVRKILLQNVSR